MKKERVDLMLDLGTLSVEDNAAITQIGLVQFDRTFEDRTTIVRINDSISLSSSVSAGLHVCPETIKWWVNQDKKVIEKVLVRSLLAKQTVELRTSLLAIARLVQELRIDYNEVVLWTWPAMSDITWLKNAFKACEISWPFKYHETRCVKPLSEAYYLKTGGRIQFREDYDTTSIEGDQHDAVYDCRVQIARLESFNNWMKGLGSEKE